MIVCRYDIYAIVKKAISNVEVFVVSGHLLDGLARAGVTELLHLGDGLTGLRFEDGLYLIDRLLQEGLLLHNLFLPDVPLEVVELVVEEVIIFGEEAVDLCQFAHLLIVVGAPVAA